MLTNNSMKYWSKRIMELTKIDFKYHNLRHTYATTCAINNVNLQMLMSMMGHKKLETTQTYYINIDNVPLRQRTFKIIDNMFTYQTAPMPIDEPPSDTYTTIDSKNRKTKYIKW